MVFQLNGENKPTREIAYLRVIYFFCIGALAFALWRINFYYDFTDYNLFFWPLFLVVLLSPVLHRRGVPLVFSVAQIIIPTHLMIFGFVMISGGITSPGVVWFSVLPVVLGLLLGRKGLVAGILAMLSLLLLMFLASYLDIGRNIVAENGKEHFETVLNIVQFYVFVSLHSVFLLRIEENRIEKIQLKKKDSDSMVRVLLHDFATPLTILQIETMKLRSIDSSGLSPETTAKIQRTVENMVTLLNQIRELRALKGNSSLFDFSLVDLQSTLKATLNHVAGAALKKRISFNLDIPQEEVLVVSDEKALREIVIQALLQNAILSSPEDTWIDVRLSREEHKGQMGCLLQVQDFGVPFSKEQINSIFGLEQKVTHISRTSEFIYSFPLLKEYVTKVGGDVWVESKSNEGVSKGNVFNVFFPALDS